MALTETISPYRTAPVVICTVLLLLLFPLSAKAVDVPFQEGERLDFVVTWGAIPVGEGILEVRPSTVVKGVEARHFVMTVRTNGFADLFYKVRDHMEGFTDKAMTRSLLYTKLSEGKSKRNEMVEFDWKKKRAHYFNHGKKNASVKLSSASFDPLSIFFAFRIFDLQVGRTLEIPVSDGKRLIQGRAEVVKREEVYVGGSDYDTWLVRVDMSDVDGVFKKSRDAELFVWVTADERRIPVRMQSSVVVGSFVVELVEAPVSKSAEPEVPRVNR